MTNSKAVFSTARLFSGRAHSVHPGNMDANASVAGAGCPVEVFPKKLPQAEVALKAVYDPTRTRLTLCAHLIDDRIRTCVSN
ncbi:MAG: hypothetical protein ACREV4_11160 [Gammaproteobacteria bacterium]